MPAPPAQQLLSNRSNRLTYAGYKRADERTRTADLLITSELLYQLSYVGLLRCVSISQRMPAFIRWRAAVPKPLPAGFPVYWATFWQRRFAGQQGPAWVPL